MANKPELTAVETLMQEIGLALLKFTGYELGEVKVTTEAEVEVEVAEEPKPKATATKTRGRKPKPEPVEEVEDDADDDEDDDSNELTKADLEKKTERQLRTIAVEMGFDKEDVKGADKETLINSILSDDDEDEDEEDDADEDDTAEDSVDVDALVAKLEGMTLVAVKKVAREEYGFKAPDYKGMDKDAVIELIVEKISDSDVEDDDDDEEAPYTEEELDSMSMADLKTICKEWGIKIKIGEKKQAHIDAILDAQEEDE